VATAKQKAPSELDDAIDGMPKIVDVKEMPRPRRGRRGIDLSALEELLQDKNPHSFEGITDRNEREKWARRVREAAAHIGLEASTTYVEDEGRLYFQGYDLGTAPARGRRSASTRKA
jgi:hypothetical protein